MKYLLFSVGCALVLGVAWKAQAQQAGDKGSVPVQFVKVAPKDVQIDPFVSSTPATKYRGRIVYDDQAADRTDSYDGHPPRNHIVLRRVGGAALNAGALAVYLSKGESGAPYDPQFSPDGRFVLWKFGIIGGPYVTYEMYILDQKTGAVKRVGNPLTGQAYQPSLREVYWSPDSKFLAWGEDVDFNKPGVNLSTTFSLHVCNWRTGQSRVVATGDEVRHSFSWAAPHTMLWSQLPQHLTNLPAPSDDQLPFIKEHARLLAINGTEGAPHELFADAYRAVISPSGKRIAFLGSPNPGNLSPLHENWAEDPGSALAVCVAARNGSRRETLSQNAPNSAQFLWQRDDRHLLSLEIKHTAIYNPPILNKPNSYNITLRQFDVTTHKVRVLAESLPGGDSDRLLSVSADDQTVCLFTSESLDLIQNKIFGGAYKIGNSIIAIDLKTGKQTVIARTINALGLDWHEDAR